MYVKKEIIIISLETVAITFQVVTVCQEVHTRYHDKHYHHAIVDQIVTVYDTTTCNEGRFWPNTIQSFADTMYVDVVGAKDVAVHHS
jgi:hypothetical protein